MANERALLEKHLEKCSPRVQRNTTVVTPEDLKEALGFDKEGYTGESFFHISKDTGIRKFIPQLTLRGSPEECRDITRVYVAPTLLGCILGYANMEAEFFELKSDASELNYKGGFKIYDLPFQAALKPNKSMVHDQLVSDEHWMVSYSAETREFVPSSAGRFFVHSLHYAARSKSYPVGSYVLYVDITKEEGLPFSKHHYLKKGCWKITGTVSRNTNSWKDDEDFEVESISKGEYMGEKMLKAALLSHDHPAVEWSK